jgi:hypothetical protein
LIKASSVAKFSICRCFLEISVDKRKIKSNEINNVMANKKLAGILNPSEFANLNTGSGKITAAEENKATSNQRNAYFSFNFPLLIENKTKPIIKIAKTIPTIGLFN